MTVLDASTKLWNWFSKNDTFCIDNMKDVVLISEDFDAEWATLNAALVEFERANVVIKSSVPNSKSQKKTPEQKDFWVLKKKFSSYEQNVAVSSNVALLLANLINETGEAFGEEDWVADPLNLKEMDILRVTEFCRALINKNKDA